MHIQHLKTALQKLQRKLDDSHDKLLALSRRDEVALLLQESRRRRTSRQYRTVNNSTLRQSEHSPRMLFCARRVRLLKVTERRATADAGHPAVA